MSEILADGKARDRQSTVNRDQGQKEQAMRQMTIFEVFTADNYAVMDEEDLRLCKLQIVDEMKVWVDNPRPDVDEAFGLILAEYRRRERAACA